MTENSSLKKTPIGVVNLIIFQERIVTVIVVIAQVRDLEVIIYLTRTIKPEKRFFDILWGEKNHKKKRFAVENIGTRRK